MEKLKNIEEQKPIIEAEFVVVEVIEEFQECEIVRAVKECDLAEYKDFAKQARKALKKVYGDIPIPDSIIRAMHSQK